MCFGAVIIIIIDIIVNIIIRDYLSTRRGQTWVWPPGDAGPNTLTHHHHLIINIIIQGGDAQTRAVRESSLMAPIRRRDLE